MNINPIQHPITEQDWNKDEAPTEGVTDAYAWYEAKVLADQLDAVKFNLKHVITVLESRRTDHMKVISDLLRENAALKDRLKGKTDETV